MLDAKLLRMIGPLALRLLFGVILLVIWEPVSCVADVPLRLGTCARFANVTTGQLILGTRDGFVERMSPVDRILRMERQSPVSEDQYLAHVQRQVQSWKSQEKDMLTEVLTSIGSRLSMVNIALPETVWLIKTSGYEEGHLAYTRQNAIILPLRYLHRDPEFLKELLCHELFHIYTRYHPDHRTALYRILGFEPCEEVSLPERLLQMKITNPDAYHHDFFIRIGYEGKRLPAVPVLYSNAETYQGGFFEYYVVSKLLLLQETENGMEARLDGEGNPILVAQRDVDDFVDQIGRNTHYIIHPEETLADNFWQVVLGDEKVVSPRVHHMLRKVLKTGNPPFFLAGRFQLEWESMDASPKVFEISKNMREWHVEDILHGSMNRMVVADPSAWLHEQQFLRIRSGALDHIDHASANALVWVPPGEFLMGSPREEVGREGIQERQRLIRLTKGFWIGKFEVTQDLYQQVTGSNPSTFRGSPWLPVETMSWARAVKFTERLTQLHLSEGKIPEGYVYRLPTEAEWEYAARAGSTTRFYFGDDLNLTKCFDHYWFSDNATSRSRPVGLKPSNPWGIHDMHGNVAEWCRDWYGAYSTQDLVDPKGRRSGSGHVVRGGNFLSGPYETRSAARSHVPDGARNSGIGIRVVLAPEGN